MIKPIRSPFCDQCSSSNGHGVASTAPFCLLRSMNAGAGVLLYSSCSRFLMWHMSAVTTVPPRCLTHVTDTECILTAWSSANRRAYRRPLWLDKLSVVLRVTEFLSFCVCMCMYPHKTREDCVASSDGTFCHCLLVIGGFEGGLLWEQVSRSWLFEKCVWVLCLHV